MFKLLNQTHRSYRAFKPFQATYFNLKTDSRLIFTPKRLNSSETPQNASTKAPLNKNTQLPVGKDNSLRKLLVVFASGALAYFSISYYLEKRKSNAPSFEINYQSSNLPGKIKPSRSVIKKKIKFLKFYFYLNLS